MLKPDQCDKMRPRQRTAALFSAIKQHDTPSLQNLIESGVDIRAEDEEHRSALQMAIQWDNVDAVRILLEAGHSVNVQSPKGGAFMLQKAASRSPRAIIELLLAHGADVQRRNDTRNLFATQTCLELAILSDNLDAANAILDHVTDHQLRAVLLNCQDGGGLTALHHVAAAGWRGSVAFARRMIDLGAFIDAQSALGATPLYTAAGRGDREMVRLFVAQGANLGIGGPRGRSAAGAARNAGHIRLAKYIERKVRSNEEGSTEIACLYDAGLSGRREAVNALLAKGALVTMMSKEKRTALHGAARGNHVALIGYLVDRGGDVMDQANGVRQTPLDEAARYHSWDALVALMEHGADPHPTQNCSREPEFYAAEAGRLDIAQRLGGYLEPILWGAAKGGHWDLVKYALSQGADPNAKSKTENITAFDFAVKEGHFHVAQQLLLQPNVSVNKPTGHGYRSTLQYILGTRDTKDATANVIFLVWNGAAVPNADDEAARKRWPLDLWSLLVLGDRGRPRSLQSSCRLAIRFALNGDAERSVEQLPLPKSCKVYLLCKT
eukprot:m.22152 g.22152  ORF g.22152 m.22152 type:complete len:552 (+) comp28289_c0_seq1:89-1744(+)